MKFLILNAQFSAKMLLNLINDLLDLAKLENSQFTLINSNFNLLQDVIQQSVSTLDHLIQQKNIKILRNDDPPIGLDGQGKHLLKSIYSDKNRLLQIMLNFLSNALKFTPNGGNILIETVIKETQDIQEVAETSNPGSRVPDDGGLSATELFEDLNSGGGGAQV